MSWRQISAKPRSSRSRLVFLVMLCISLYHYYIVADTSMDKWEMSIPALDDKMLPALHGSIKVESTRRYHYRRQPLSWPLNPVLRSYMHIGLQFILRPRVICGILVYSYYNLPHAWHEGVSFLYILLLLCLFCILRIPIDNLLFCTLILQAYTPVS